MTSSVVLERDRKNTRRPEKERKEEIDHHPILVTPRNERSRAVPPSNLQLMNRMLHGLPAHTGITRRQLKSVASRFVDTI
jgi:hypothetical protein